MWIRKIITSNWSTWPNKFMFQLRKFFLRHMNLYQFFNMLRYNLKLFYLIKYVSSFTVLCRKIFLVPLKKINMVQWQISTKISHVLKILSHWNHVLGCPKTSLISVRFWRFYLMFSLITVSDFLLHYGIYFLIATLFWDYFCNFN